MLPQTPFTHRLLLWMTPLLLAGCLATMPAQKTASGKAEVTVQGNVAKAAVARIINEAIADENFKQWRIKSRTESDVVYERVMDTMNPYGAEKVVLEIAFMALELEGNTRIVADNASYSILAGRPTTKSDSGAASRNMAQLLLNRVQASFERRGSPSSAAPRTSADVSSGQSDQGSKAPSQPQSAPTTALTPKASTTLSMSISEAQRRLSELGYSPGPADGAMGKRTIDAIKKFQAASQLTSSGKLDAATVEALRRTR